jgi:5-formyltetrahydrofolate cyclo-ligase
MSIADTTTERHHKQHNIASKIRKHIQENEIDDIAIFVKVSASIDSQTNS